METFFARMIGKLLGDGTIIKQEGRQPRFQFMHRVEDVEWTHYCYEQLRDYIPLSEPTYGRVTDERLRKGYSERYMVQSLTHEWINQLYDIWYSSKMKAVPLTHLEQYFTAESLAWWYQDDGHLKKNKEGVVEKLVLSTECWTDEERELLKYILNLKFNLLFSVDGQKRLLLYDQLQINYFLQIVEPWMQPVMIRKMKTASPYKTIAKRTTLTVTSNFQFERPTKELNEAISHYIDNVELNAQHFQKWNYARREQNDMKSYQITLTDDNRQKLAQVQAKTGLTLNEIAQHCVTAQLIEQNPRLEHLKELTTTQHTLLFGSILADGSLEKPRTRTTSYYENSSEAQRSYRQWKVNILTPYVYFPGKRPCISSRSSQLFHRLERQFYTRERIKRIPFALLEDLPKDPHFMMALYIDDGSLMISHRVNHRNQKVYLTPHIALYLQNFQKDELGHFANWLNTIFDVHVKLARRPDGNGYILKTTTTEDTFRFLKSFESIHVTYPQGYYKTDWNYRFHVEQEKWKTKYPNYEVITSSRERMKPYSTEEVEIIIAMKQEGCTDQAIADKLGRTYWAIVYKVRELRKSKQL